MDANMHEFGKRSFQIELKIEKMIFVIAHKTTRSHLEALTAKKIWSILHLKSRSITAFARALPFSENILGGPAYFTQRH